MVETCLLILFDQPASHKFYCVALNGIEKYCNRYTNRKMKRRRTSTAALLAFTAHLLDVDIIISAASPGTTRPSKSLLLQRPTFSLQQRGRSVYHHHHPSTALFVHQESASSGGVIRKRSSHPSSSQQHTRSPSTITPTSPIQYIWKQRNVSAHLTKNRIDDVTPRYYISSGSSSSSSGGDETDDVLVYTTYEKEFSLLRPHLEFNELDLQELFNKETTSTSSSTTSSSQLYEEFEEVEIGHFQPPPPSLKEGEETIKGPFFFASPQHTSSSSTGNSKSNTDNSISVVESLDIDLTTLPPWLSLNQAKYAPRKLHRLQRDLTPHLSTKEIDEVITAIRQSSMNDQKKVAGASDFCSILVNSLEMTDVPALCAAAYHYTSLVSVRERELDDDTCPIEAERQCLETAGKDAKYLCALAGSGIEQFGNHAVKIALDAARLKSMEALATTLVCNNGRQFGQLRSEDARNLRSLLLTVNEEGDWRALALRAAACLYRLEGLEAYRTLISSASNDDKTTTTMTKKKTRFATPEESRTSQEALHIYAPLAARLGMFRLKTELEDAAFRTLYPRSHAKVKALCGGENTNVGEGMKSILSDISNQMKRLVQEDCSFMENIENVSVTARVKEPYSVWRKMLKISKEGDGVNARDLSILDIPDAVATRVVFSARKLTPDEHDVTTQRREKELCYYLYDLCTRNWPEMSDSRFKDYVKYPKDNGYQSLHYSSRKRWRGTEWPFEVQIRSKDMHRVAEYGVAAHWSYKRNDIDGDVLTNTHRLDRTSEAYLKSVQKWNESKQAAIPSWATPELEEPSEHLEEEIRRQRKRDRDETLAPYLEALSGDQTDMRENVFVFVSVQPPNEDKDSETGSVSPPSEGTVLSLPRGSRVLDAIRVTEKWSSALEAGAGNLYDGRSSFVALRNGLRTSTLGTEMVDSGDVISILPSDDLVSWSKRSEEPKVFQ